MRKMFVKLVMLFVVSSVLMASSCDMQNEPSADKKQAAQTRQALNNAASEVGMPAIVNFNELKLFKWILELRDNTNLVTYTYLHNEMDGSVGQYLGQSIGFGIPAATQFTNPERRDWVSNQGGVGYLPQADPNGLFMPTSTDATWVILIDPNGKPAPQYIEGKIDVFTFPQHKMKPVKTK